MVRDARTAPPPQIITSNEGNSTVLFNTSTIFLLCHLSFQTLTVITFLILDKVKNVRASILPSSSQQQLQDWTPISQDYISKMIYDQSVFFCFLFFCNCQPVLIHKCSFVMWCVTGLFPWFFPLFLSSTFVHTVVVLFIYT